MRNRLAAGELILRMNSRLARSVDIAMVAKASGYGALYVDMQHAPYSVETRSTICAAALGIDITPLMRVPSDDGQWMGRVLDGGAHGVIIPDVNTRAQAEAIVNACRFPPLGRRSVMWLGPALSYRAVPLVRAQSQTQRREGRHCHARDGGGHRELRCHLRGRRG